MDSVGLIRGGGIRPGLAFPKTIFVEIARDAGFIDARKITVAFRFKAHRAPNLPVIVEDDDLDLFVLAPGAIAHPARHDFSALRTKANRPPDA